MSLDDTIYCVNVMRNQCNIQFTCQRRGLYMFKNTIDMIDQFTSKEENKQTDYLKHENSN